MEYTSESNHLISIYQSLFAFYSQINLGTNIQVKDHNISKSLMANEINHLIQSVKNKVFQRDQTILSCFENIIHLLDSCSLITKVWRTTDKKLFHKAFAYFNQSLSHLVDTLHQYPINKELLLKKQYLKEKHRIILHQTEQNSIESSMFQDSEQDNTLKNQIEQLQTKNQKLELALATVEKQLVKSELKLMSALNEHRNYQTYSPIVMKKQLQSCRKQIKKMNRQFTIQIKKYNEVFRNMEQEINFLQQEGACELIEGLQTQIIKLRQQRERDQMIISELREHLTRYKSYYKNRSKTNLFY